MMFPQSQHGVILADPAWQYKMRSDKGYLKSPDQHYDCMNYEQLAAMRDDLLFATGPDAICFMWAVWPMIPQALKLMDAWGFDFVTGGSWNKITKHGKQQFGTGYVLRGSEEPFIIGKIGNPEIKNRSTRNALLTGDVPENLHDIHSISISSMLREHSRKPDEIYPLLEDLFDGPYLELFARQTRKGWASWGNQTDKFGECA